MDTRNFNMFDAEISFLESPAVSALVNLHHGFDDPFPNDFWALCETAVLEVFRTVIEIFAVTEVADGSTSHYVTITRYPSDTHVVPNEALFDRGNAFAGAVMYTRFETPLGAFGFARDVMTLLHEEALKRDPDLIP